MWKWIRRVLKLLLVAGVLVYLVITSLLNLPPVRRQLHHRLVQISNRPVTMGYIYLDWQLNPTLSYLGIGEEEFQSEELTDSIVFKHLEAVIDWDQLVGGPRINNPVRLVRKLNIQSMRVNKSLTPGEESDGELDLPALPVEIEGWEYNFIAGGKKQFKCGGTNLKYFSPASPAKFSLNSVAGKPATGSGEVVFSPALNLKIDMDYFSLQDEYWGGFSSSWRGHLEFATDAPDWDQLDLELTGLPGRFQNFYFPPLSVDFSLRVDSREFLIDKFKFKSDYLNGGWEGAIRRDGEIENLAGEFSFQSRYLFDWVSRFNEKIDFNVQQVGNIQGRVKLKNNIKAPQPEGELNIPGSAFILSLPSVDFPVQVAEWQANFADNRLRWQKGSLSAGGIALNLSSGVTALEEEILTTTFTGLLNSEQFGKNIFPSELQKFAGKNSLRLPVNLTFEFGSGGFQASFLTREGKMGFSDYNFENIWLFASYSSFDPFTYNINGQFLGPDGNSWKIVGENDHPLKLSTAVKTVDHWLKLFDEWPDLFQQKVNLENTQLNVHFIEPFVNWGDFTGELSFDGGRLFFSNEKTGLSNLKGSIQFEPDLLRVENLRGNTARGELSLAGRLDHQNWFKSGELDFELQGNNLYSSDFFPAGSIFKFANMNFSGEARGSLSQPWVETEISGDSIGAGNFKLSDLAGKINIDREQVSFAVESSELAGGKFQGGLTGDNIDDLKLNFQVDEARLDKLFEHNEYIKKNITGTASVAGEATGSLMELKSWDGEIEVEHSSINLAHFPDVSGISRVADLQEIGRDININSGLHNLSLEEGVIKLENIIFKAPAKDMELKIKGDIGLDGSLDLQHDLILRGVALRSYLQDLIGDVFRGLGLSPEREFTIRFYVQGTVFNPVFKLDVDHARRNLQQDFITSFLSERLGKPISRLLNSLF
ncbi:MAG: AsmA-like C-terminal region-containing protein [bacterium]